MFSLSLSVKWLAVKTVQNDRDLSGGALNSTSTDSDSPFKSHLSDNLNKIYEVLFLCL